MSKAIRSVLASLGVAAVATSIWTASAEAAEQDSPPATIAAQLETFARPEGDTYFAMKLTPGAARPAATPHDVVIIFDTSASQSGAYRTKATSALNAVLSGLDAHDRVALVAVDLGAVRLTKSFVAVNSDELRQGLAQLNERVPLGSTDMSAAVQAAVAASNEQAAAGRECSAIYIGDGMSTAGLVASGKLQVLVDALVESRIPLSSYAIGPRVDAALLGALANHTGGMLAVDYDEMTGAQAGNYLAEAARQPVVWPSDVKLSDAVREMVPRRMPPLRFDRDTVVLGKLADPAAAVEIDASAELAGKTEQLHWRSAPAAASDDNAYLAKLVDGAEANGGISLAAVGSAGLDAQRRMMNIEAQNYSRLGQQALATGDVERARQLAAAAAQLDPMNPEAATVLKLAANVSRKANQADAEDDAAPAAGQAAPEGAGAATRVDADADGALLDEVERQDRVFVQFLQSEVMNTINQAKGLMGFDPESAANNLKLVMEKVRQAPELDPEVRAQLIDKIEGALQSASRQALVKAEKDLRRQQIESEEKARQRIVKDLYLQEEKIDQLMARFNALMDEERYRDAEAVANLAEEMSPNTSGLRTAELWSRMAGYTADMAAVADARHKGVTDSLYQVELSHVPTPDEPPILYPDPEVWQLLTERRKKYKAVDLTENNPNEAKIIAALDDKTELEFVDQPLSDVIDYLKERHAIEIQLDTKALTDAGLGSDTPVTRNIRGITLRSALRLMLSEMDLTYVIRDEVLMITSKTEAENMLSTKVYPVADLVMPIGPMRGGGGGGFFNIAPEPRSGFRAFAVQDLKLSGKSKKTKSAAKPAPAKKPAAASKPAPKAAPSSTAYEQAQQALSSGKPASDAAPRAVAAKKAKNVEVIHVEIKEGADPAAAWNDYFAAHKDDLAPSTSSVRKTAQKLMESRKFEEVIGLIDAALRNQQGQPWMFEALGLAMQAAQRTPAEVERALMSALDFTSDPTDMMYLAQYLARANLNQRALQLFRQVGELDPSAPEPFVHGLRLGQKLDDLDAIQWSTVGILSQAWSQRQLNIWQEAFRAAEATLDRLRSEGRKSEAEAYQDALDKALVRDCVVIVSWTGDADVDMFVEEPTGSVCSYHNPRTTAGGMMLGDAASAGQDRKSESASEVYVCPKGFDGKYRVLVRRVWGKVPANKVTMDIYWHYFSKKEKQQTKQIELVNDEAVAAFELNEGRRTEPLAEQQVANAAAGQVAAGRQLLLNQQLNALNNPQALGSFLSNSNPTGEDVPGFNPNNPFTQFGFKGAVGYQPVITTLPKGAQMFTNAVVSADRRYVRISPIPFFSGVTEVNTFNYVSGASGTSNGAGGGGFGSSGGGGGF